MSPRWDEAHPCIFHLKPLLVQYRAVCADIKHLHNVRLHALVDQPSACHWFKEVDQGLVNRFLPLIDRIRANDDKFLEVWDPLNSYYVSTWNYFTKPELFCEIAKTLEEECIPDQRASLEELRDFVTWAEQTCERPEEGACEPGEIGLYTEAMIHDRSS